MSEQIDVNTLFGPTPAVAADLLVDELVDLMAKHDVRACCTLSTVGVLLDHHAGNAATRAACGENHSLIPVATLNPMTDFSGGSEVAKLQAEGFRMLRVFPQLQGWPVAYAPFVVVARAVDTTGLPIMVAIDAPGDATRLLASMGTHKSPIVLSGVDERTVSEAVALMRLHPELRIETSRLLAMGAIEQVVEHVGAERILFGSGAPARPMASALNLVKYAAIDESQRVQILGGNAARLLGL